MTNYIFIESREPFDSNDTPFLVETTTTLKQRGHAVTVFLVQNGTLAARRQTHASVLPSLLAAGIEVLADDFSLRERGLLQSELSAGIQPATMEELIVGLVAPNTKVIWH